MHQKQYRKVKKNRIWDLITRMTYIEVKDKFTIKIPTGPLVLLVLLGGVAYLVVKYVI